MNDAQSIIEALDLQPHPEGGHYAETWRADAAEGERPSGTAIYYLLRAGEHSQWHRVDAAEIWHFYAGTRWRSRWLRAAVSSPRNAICSART